MKRYIITFSILFIALVGYGQSAMNYKAVIKDNLGNVIANQQVTVQFAILQGVSQITVYQETHAPTTDANGVIIVNIGEGTSSDVFTDINWGVDDHFLNVQIDTGSGIVDLGTTQFMAVPYALSAANAANKIDDLLDGKSDDSSLFLGLEAGINDNATSNRNIGLGYQALASNIAGEGNVALGYRAGFNETGSDKLYIDNTDTNNPLIYGDFNTDKLTLNGDVNITGNLSLNHIGSQIGSASFTLTQANEGYGGMYVNSLGVNNASPFYGYAVGNTSKAWHYYHDFLSSWILNVDGDKIKVNSENTLIYNKLLINTENQINPNTDLTLKSNSFNGFGGMYVDMDGSGYSSPFYGYAINGAPKAYSFYKEADSTWNLNVGDVYTDALVVENDNLKVNGSITLATENAVTKPVGTIYYYQDHFYGNTSTGIKRLDNTTTSKSAYRESEEVSHMIQMLKDENELLKKELSTIKSHLAELEKNVLSKNDKQ
ncbi:hypothetical protein ACFSSB_00425 [Lacinutrix gracilariae]|uniref:Peptidase S74 domain-containing protein n=1 Tax=Lacinutrix gracilariae TaxID=1747198 RepID=A0ABW5JXT2_9FLAO